MNSVYHQNINNKDRLIETGSGGKRKTGRKKLWGWGMTGKRGLGGTSCKCPVKSC